MYKFNSITEALEDLKKGRMIIVVDDPNRENEGDLVLAGEFATGENINFMAKYGKGLICTPCRKELLEKLNIDSMVRNNTDFYGTDFTVTIDHIDTTTGISAFERAKTIREISNQNSNQKDFRRPGHVFPLIAKKHGVLERRGHTEASIDLMEIAGLKPIAVICEVMKDDGNMARVPDLIKFKDEHNLKIITIEDLINYRKKVENHIEIISKAEMPTKYGKFKIYGFLDKITKKEHMALVMGDIASEETVLMRLHSQCVTGDAFGSMRCDCGEQYDLAMKNIAKKGKGVLIYMSDEGRGIGILNKIKAYKLQDEGYDTVDANIELGFDVDLRDYSVGAKILKLLGISKIDIMTNNLEKVRELEEYGIEVVNRIPIIIQKNKENYKYLETKKLRMKHIL